MRMVTTGQGWDMLKSDCYIELVSQALDTPNPRLHSIITRISTLWIQRRRLKYWKLMLLDNMGALINCALVSKKTKSKRFGDFKKNANWLFRIFCSAGYSYICFEPTPNHWLSYVQTKWAPSLATCPLSTRQCSYYILSRRTGSLMTEDQALFSYVNLPAWRFLSRHTLKLNPRNHESLETS